MNDRDRRDDSSERGPRKKPSEQRGNPGGRRGDQRPRRDGDAKPRREGDWKPRRDNDGKPRRDGDWKSRRDSDRKPRRDGEWKPRRDGDWKPRRDGDDRRGGGRPSNGRGGTRGGGRSDRGGQGRTFSEAERIQHALRPVRSEHEDPEIPRDVTEEDLYNGARNELKTLQPETQEKAARHLAMVLMLIDENPELAHQHALSASRRAGRIPVAREFLAMTAYRTGDYALALRELRTFRRLSGKDTHVALMVESERALGRPQKAIETALEVDASRLPTEQRAHLAIALSGARLDLGQVKQALYELEIPELDPKRAFHWSPELFGAYSAVLEDLGRDKEAREWQRRAQQAADALDEAAGVHDQFDVLEIVEMREPVSEDVADAEPKPATESETSVLDAPETEESN